MSFSSDNTKLVNTLWVVIAVLAVFLAWQTIRIYSLSTPPATPIIVEGTTPEELRAPNSPFLEEEEVVVVSHEYNHNTTVTLPIEKVLFEYVEVTGGCGPHFDGECLNVRSGPSTEYDVVRQLRNGMVLKVAGTVENEGRLWYKVAFDEFLFHPDRIKGDWYIAADYVEVLYDEGDHTIWNSEYPETNKQIFVNLASQKLYAYEGDTLVLVSDISTGLELTPTPAGKFTIFKKTPSRYMQGPLPGITDQYYDMPGVPWNLYFTEQGAVIHGAYWHDSFGSTYSHGCVNLPPNTARELYNWAELGMPVIIEDLK